MCGRTGFSLQWFTFFIQNLKQLTANAISVEDLPQRAGDTQNRTYVNLTGPWRAPSNYRPSYNVGPMRYQPVIVRTMTDSIPDTYLHSMRWGVVPSWSKIRPDYGSVLRTINARDDTILQTKSMWTSMKNHQRCVVLAEGFFEWLKKGKERIPYYVTPKDDQLFFFAGLYDKVILPEESEPLFTYAIITTNVSSSLSFLHNRMPVLLTTEEIDIWIDPTVPFEKVASMLMPRETTQYVKVSNYVNKVGNEGEKCTEEVRYDAKGTIESFFNKMEPTRSTNSITSEFDLNSSSKEEMKCGVYMSEVNSEFEKNFGSKEILTDSSESIDKKKKRNNHEIDEQKKDNFEDPSRAIQKKSRPSIGEQIKKAEISGSKSSKPKKISTESSRSISDFFKKL
ncbi:hypothetical protein HK096_003802 [Nowakowskiella sp. JEL0078]|nr:hypothetical protein HK096_003802 [Nowakowskiella sp. JEL0078]